ncbi:ABC transporter substrate-binding protein [Leekyejoonella antrihumi]|uniref:Glycine/betaine ABC transporter substrate-binding protein n=1 Tax=Leekyejoonella antrihumi TaxID=1660198 RepID=A0A563DYZ8_9MICO|nr:ABC transporter substrate-binding protein [Leekyejoonella antrihumi]TWP35488.1 glycine/betaine ABC transporter substrate-binding protein [Leekyejoonella antrihumi]
MSHNRRRLSQVAAGTGAVALLVAGCGGARVGASTGPGAGGAAAGNLRCGQINLAMNDWVGYTADGAVYSYVAEHSMGCTVKQIPLAEQVSWQGFSTGQVDLILENWGHADLAKKYITQQKVAVDLGANGNIGQIGWFVPPWMVTKYPGILDWKNLNKYASLFKTSESGGQGELLDGDPSYVTNDAALVKNLHLNYKVVVGGSEAALITSFRQAQTHKTPLLAYFYSPQWFLSEVDLKKVSLPKYTPGCDANLKTITCDYPTDQLNKVAATAFATKNPAGFLLAKAFNWTNQDQDVVAKYIAEDKMTPAAAAAKWVKANRTIVNNWLLGIPGAKPL